MESFEQDMSVLGGRYTADCLNTTVLAILEVDNESQVQDCEASEPSYS